MSTINYVWCKARDGLKRNSSLLGKPFGLNLLDKRSTIERLEPYKVVEDLGGRVTMPTVKDFTDPSKTIFDGETVNSGQTHVWRYERNGADATVLRNGCLKVGRDVFNTDFGAHAVFRDILKWSKRPTREVRTVIAPWGHYWCRYYDFLFYVVAKLCRMKDALPSAEFDEAIVTYPLARTAFERELLDLIGIGPERLVDSRTTHVRFERCIVGDNNTYYYANRMDVAALQRHIGSQMTPPSRPPRRIYVSRAGRRRVLNEDALMAVLRRYDFEMIEDRPRSIAEQYAIYNNASFIIGPHGASFANLLWCRPDTQLIELFPDNYAPTYFRYLSETIGIRYHAHAHGTIRHHHSNPSVDLQVSVAGLERQLETLLESGTPAV